MSNERFVDFSDICSDSWFTALFDYKIKRSEIEVIKKLRSLRIG